MTRENRWLAGGLLGAFLLRIWGFQQGYPEFYGHVDEVGVAASVWNFYRSATLMPTEFTYPAFYSYLNAGGLWLSYWLGLLTDVGSVWDSVVFASYVDPARSALTGRFLSAAASTLTVLVTYLLARRACGPTVAAIAFVFSASAVVPVVQAHHALPDSTMALWAALTFYLAWRIYESGRTVLFVLGGVSAGLLVATKYNGGLVAISLVAAYILHRRRFGLSLIAGEGIGKMGLCVGVAFLTMSVASPYLVLAYDKYLALGRYQMSSLGFSLAETTPWWWVIQGFVDTDYLIGALFIAGGGVSAMRRSPLDLIFLAAWLPSFLYIGSWTRESLHYLLQFYPLLTILAAGIAHQVVARFSPRQDWLHIVVAFLCVAPNLITVIGQNRERGLADTRELSANWIATNIPDGATIAMTWLPYCPRLPLHDARLGILGYYSGEERLRRRLEEEWRGQPAYRLVNMAVWLKTPWVPHGLRDEVDLSDAETERVFRRVLLTPSQLKTRGAQYMVVPAAIYERYLRNDPPPGHGAARYHHLKNRAYFEQLLGVDNPHLESVYAVEDSSHTRGGAIRVFRLI
jgi:4-amino-4-deoxy-L-arabinose transferase-like glycosyltransferase